MIQLFQSARLSRPEAMLLSAGRSFFRKQTYETESPGVVASFGPYEFNDNPISRVSFLVYRATEIRHESLNSIKVSFVTHDLEVRRRYHSVSILCRGVGFVCVQSVFAATKVNLGVQYISLMNREPRIHLLLSSMFALARDSRSRGGYQR